MAKASATIDVSALRVAGEGATKYITTIDEGGIKVHNAGDETNCTQITSNGVEIFQNNNSVASFGSSVVIGSSSDATITMTNDTIQGAGADDKFFFRFAGDGGSDAVAYNSSKVLTEADNNMGVIGVRLQTPAFGTNSSNARATFSIRPKSSSGGMSTGVAFTEIPYGGSSYSNTQTYTLGGVSYDFIVNHPINAKYFGMSVQPASILESYDITLYVLFVNTEPAPTYVLGGECEATGAYAYAEGYKCTASGDYSHAHGYGITTSNPHLTAFGQYNEDYVNNVFEVGNGGSDSNRKNAFAVDADNRAYANGNLLPQLMSKTISGTTSTSANISTGITISTGIVIGFQSNASNSYAFIPFCRSDGTWYLHAMQANANQAALASTAVSGTVYYLAT